MYPFNSKDYDPSIDYAKLQAQFEELIYEKVKKKKEEDERKKKEKNRVDWKYLFLLLLCTSWPVAVGYHYMANFILNAIR